MQHAAIQRWYGLLCDYEIRVSGFFFFDFFIEELHGSVIPTSPRFYMLLYTWAISIARQMIGF